MESREQAEYWHPLASQPGARALVQWTTFTTFYGNPGNYVVGTVLAARDRVPATIQLSFWWGRQPIHEEINKIISDNGECYEENRIASCGRELWRGLLHYIK